jgi:hypothetical protein
MFLNRDSDAAAIVVVPAKQWQLQIKRPLHKLDGPHPDQQASFPKQHQQAV